MNARCLILCTALLFYAIDAYGEGTYQRVHRGKGLVWNDNPSGGEVATWRGDMDEDGYATGHGTITWYRLERKKTVILGSNIPTARYVRIKRYSGKMVRGKLDGPVLSVDSGGAAFHATFAKGRKTTDWAAGPPPSPTQPDTVVEKTPDEPVPRAELVEAAAAKPSPVPEQRVEQPVATPAEKKPANDYDDSLRALVGPPRILRTKEATEAATTQATKAPTPSPPPRPSLTSEEAIALADAEARTQGFNLDDYQRPQARYSTENGTWSLSYDHHATDANGETGKPLNVTVEDKTKKTSVVR